MDDTTPQGETVVPAGSVPRVYPRRLPRPTRRQLLRRGITIGLVATRHFGSHALRQLRRARAAARSAWPSWPGRSGRPSRISVAPT